MKDNLKKLEKKIDNATEVLETVRRLLEKIECALGDCGEALGNCEWAFDSITEAAEAIHGIKSVHEPTEMRVLVLLNYATKALEETLENI